MGLKPGPRPIPLSKRLTFIPMQCPKCKEIVNRYIEQELKHYAQKEVCNWCSKLFKKSIFLKEV